MKQGKSRYVYIALTSVLLLFRTETGVFGDKEKTAQIEAELLAALGKKGLLNKEESAEKTKDDPEEKRLKLAGFAPIPYKIKEGRLSLQREACFSAFGLEQVLIRNSRGYLAINDILAKSETSLENNKGGVDGDWFQEGSNGEKFGYVSLRALLKIMESQDPILVCLEQKDSFSRALMHSIQSGGVTAARGEDGEEEELAINGETTITSRAFLGRLYLSKTRACALSGLDPHSVTVSFLREFLSNADSCFLDGEKEDFVSAEALLALLNREVDGIARASSSDCHKHHWQNLISAVQTEAPRLRTRIKMAAFREGTAVLKYGLKMENLGITMALILLNSVRY